MQNVQVKDELLDALRELRDRIQASTPVRKLIANWDRTIEVRAVTFPRRSFFLTTRAGEMLEPTTQAASEPAITIVADEHVLTGIFRGELNPARAHLDGQLQAVGAQKDQLVLDSIVLLVWGY